MTELSKEKVNELKEFYKERHRWSIPDITEMTGVSETAVRRYFDQFKSEEIGKGVR